jgi:spore coat protein U-like protein
MRALLARISAIATALPALGAADPALAACSNPTNCSCMISTSGLLFGTYSQQSIGPTDSVGTISTTCTSDDPGNSTFSISLSAGNSGNASQRAMTGGSGGLLYNLFTNATRSTVWGDDTGGGVSVVAMFPQGSGNTQLISVYGRIPARQNVAPGLYGDVIVVTITY